MYVIGGLCYICPVCDQRITIMPLAVYGQWLSSVRWALNLLLKLLNKCRSEQSGETECVTVQFSYNSVLQSGD